MGLLITAYAFVMVKVRGLVRTFLYTLLLLCVQVRKPLGTRGTCVSRPVHIMTTQLTGRLVFVTIRVDFSRRAFFTFYDPHFAFWTSRAFLFFFVPVWSINEKLIAAPADAVLG